MRGFSLNVILCCCALAMILLFVVSCASTPDKSADTGEMAVADEKVKDTETQTASGEKENIVAPKLIRHVDPNYPKSMRVARLQGVVTVRATIDREGNVKNPRIIQSVNEVLDAEAIKCVSQWTYEPGIQDGELVDVEITMTVEFRLR